MRESAGVGSDDRVDVAEGDVVRAERMPVVSPPCAREAVAEGAHQVRAEHRGQARGHALVVGKLVVFGGAPGNCGVPAA